MTQEPSSLTAKGMSLTVDVCPLMMAHKTMGGSALRSPVSLLPTIRRLVTL
jgi:hypothetical protein